MPYKLLLYNKLPKLVGKWFIHLSVKSSPDHPSIV